MNIPTSVEAVAVIVILFIPGYIFLQFTKNAVAFIPQGTDVRYFFAFDNMGRVEPSGLLLVDSATA